MIFFKILKKSNEAVSPVVGTMLMLTLVIILAAVISGFAGGFAGSSGGSCDIQITAQTSIVNTGESAGSKFEIDILSVSSPVSTKDLKLKTSWKTYDTDEKLISNDTAVSPGSDNFDYNGGGVSPLGSGPGLSEWNRTTNSLPDDINFGKYALMAGTRMAAYPADEYGETVTSDYNGFTGTDSIQAVLGEDWYKLKSGDVVSVMLIHVPSGRIIYDDDIYVNG